MFWPRRSMIWGVLGAAFLSVRKRSKGFSLRKRRQASMVAPPQVSRPLKPMPSRMGAAGSICWVLMRVAAMDWWPSRRTVLLKRTGFIFLSHVHFSSAGLACFCQESRTRRPNALTGICDSHSKNCWPVAIPSRLDFRSSRRKCRESKMFTRGMDSRSALAPLTPLAHRAGEAEHARVCFARKMKSANSARPRCIVIAGPNGAGKTTFAQDFLLKGAGVVHFVNADLIASGLSPFRPESAAVAAGRLYLKEVDRLASARVDFAFETTLSGLSHLARLRRWKASGY